MILLILQSLLMTASICFLWWLAFGRNYWPKKKVVTSVDYQRLTREIDELCKWHRQEEMAMLRWKYLDEVPTHWGQPEQWRQKRREQEAVRSPDQRFIEGLQHGI